MDATFLERGFIIGLSIAAPVGPISLLCMKRTLAEGRLSGVVSGLGAATADAAYGFVAAFGLTFISDMLIDQQMWLRFFGGLYLSYLGVRQLLDRSAKRQAFAGDGGRGFFAAYAQTFFLTLTNPMTVLSFGAFFAGMGLMSAIASDVTASNMSAWALVAGVFSGSLFWWIILSFSVGAFRESLDQRALLWVNRISGAIITGFGLVALLS